MIKKKIRYNVVFVKNMYENEKDVMILLSVELMVIFVFCVI